MSLRQMENLTSYKYCGTCGGGVLVTQERMIDADGDKVDADTKTAAPYASDASNIDTPNIDVKRGIGKPCTVAIELS